MNIIVKHAIITSKNDSYNDFKDKHLTIIKAYNKGQNYDSSMYPMLLCEFKDSEDNYIPYALYQYEFKLID